MTNELCPLDNTHVHPSFNLHARDSEEVWNEIGKKKGPRLHYVYVRTYALKAKKKGSFTVNWQ
jgi:hypothetical protein